MSVIGIVCEFNPFHNGHKHLIDSVKKQGDTVVCVMSGNYVQRGEPAYFPKDVRVKTALINGADIVLELPFVYATSSAEYFAMNAVKILDSFGCDEIAFGSEGANVNDLNKVVDILLNKDFNVKVKDYLETGVSYPSARDSALKDYNCDFDVSAPNNILAIEYLKSIRELNSNMKAVIINRIGVGYNDDCAVDNISSATHIRNLIKSKASFEKYVPNNSYELYKECIEKGNALSIEKYNSSLLGILRTKTYYNSANIANMAEGLENRIIDSIKASESLDEIYDRAKTKRYTHSRIRRAVLSLAFGVTTNDLNISAPYCRLLGFNKNCSDILGKLASGSKLPYIVTYNDLIKIDNENAKRIFELECLSTDIYSLIMNRTDICSKEMTFSPVKL